MENETRPSTVLVAEDNSIVNWDVAEALRDDGFDTLQAYSGEQALTLLENHRDIRVVFTDVNLPGAITVSRSLTRSRNGGRRSSC